MLGTSSLLKGQTGDQSLQGVHSESGDHMKIENESECHGMRITIPTNFPTLTGLR